MNSYERIQKAIDYIEDNLTNEIEIRKTADMACFSLSHFYRLFHAHVGHTVKDYITKRRLTEAALRLINTNDKLIDICYDCQFEYQESFTRSFKNLFGVSPGLLRKKNTTIKEFPKIDLVEKYFLHDDRDGIPDCGIKVLKKMKPGRVAYYQAVSTTPERDAFTKLMDWANNQSLLKSDSSCRIFGFNIPSPSKDKSIYGYESWITVDDNVKESDGIKIKNFQGGLYAVTGTTVANIQNAWSNFVIWLDLSIYTNGTHQCLEEHFWPLETKEENIHIDLYLPIKK